MEEVLLKTTKWLEKIVIGLGLCPFAAKAKMAGQIGFKVLPYSPKGLTSALNQGINEVLDPENHLSTLLMVISEGLEDFNEYLDIYYGIEEELKNSGLSEEIQLAGFHPDYQFNEVDKDDIQNYTNRSPYPVIHILRVDEVSAAIESHPDIDSIPAKNIETMKKLGLEGLLELYK